MKIILEHENGVSIMTVLDGNVRNFAVDVDLYIKENIIPKWEQSNKKTCISYRALTEEELALIDGVSASNIRLENGAVRLAE